VVRFEGSDVSPRIVIAASVEIHGEHLVYLRLDGRLVALFMLEMVESWSEFDLYEA
jgi:hypothetical protein